MQIDPELKSAADALSIYTPIEVRQALTRREQKVLMMRAARGGTAPPPTYDQIGAAIGVKKERARQIINASLLRLRVHRERGRLEELHADLMSRHVQRGALLLDDRRDAYPMTGSLRRIFYLSQDVEREERRADWQDRPRDRAEERAWRRSPDRKRVVREAHRRRVALRSFLRLQAPAPKKTKRATRGSEDRKRKRISPAIRDQREIIGSAQEAIAKRGVRAVRLKDILNSRPRSRFYACFGGMDDCFAAVLEAGTDDLLAAAEADGITGLLERVKERPTLAQVAFLEGPSIDLAATELFLAALTDQLINPLVQRAAAELRACALFHLMGVAARRGSLASLANDRELRALLAGSQAEAGTGLRKGVADAVRSVE